MKSFSAIFVIIFSSLLLLFLSCDQQTTTPMSDDDSNISYGIMKISLDMHNAPSDVVNIEGRLSNINGDEINFKFDIYENFASALVEDIPIGAWVLEVNALDKNDNIIYTGIKEITVYPGVITPVSIQLNPATGSIQITVIWGDICKDIDGNVYKAVKIGDQIWMAENLRVTHYQNGDEIQKITNGNEWSSKSSGAYCVYQNNDAYIDDYGLLYNWFTIKDSRKIAPRGWHVPTDEEWKKLEIYLGMDKQEANAEYWRGHGIIDGKIKEIGTAHWVQTDASVTNETGFTALPGGYRDGDTGNYQYLRIGADFWSATEYDNISAWHRIMNYGNTGFHRHYSLKQYGHSIRCVKD